jgi:endonuclease-3 related protein
MKEAKILLEIYRRLRREFGHRGWWPGRTRFEVIVGAILTQNTSWKNVERAIRSLRQAGALTPHAMRRLPLTKLARLIRSSGYFRMKAARLKHFLRFLFGRYAGNLNKMFSRDQAALREELLGIHGIGPETADSILLYAGAKPSFVVDAYTRRIFSRHHFLSEKASYGEVQDYFVKNLAADPDLYNDYHAQLVKIGNTFCRKREPLCNRCPLEFLFHLKRP